MKSKIFFFLSFDVGLSVTITNDGLFDEALINPHEPSLVIVNESPTSDERKKKIFDFIDDLLQKTGKVGEYDQKI